MSNAIALFLFWLSRRLQRWGHRVLSAAQKLGGWNRLRLEGLVMAQPRLWELVGGVTVSYEEADAAIRREHPTAWSVRGNCGLVRYFEGVDAVAEYFPDPHSDYRVRLFFKPKGGAA